MAFVRGPKIITQDLCFLLDAADKNSYPATGNSWIDRTPNKNNCTLINNPSFSGLNGGVLVFNGDSQYASGISSSSLNLTDDFTIESWVKTDSSSSDAAILTYGNPTGEQYSFYIGQQRVSPESWQQASSLNLLDNVWYHSAVTFNSGNWNIYINGLINTSGSFNSSSLTPVSGSVLKIGVYDFRGSEFFDGQIGLIRVYNKVLTASQIQKNFTTQRKRFDV